MRTCRSSWVRLRWRHRIEQIDVIPPGGYHAAPVVVRMQSLTQQWEAADDARGVFLKCYSMMTHNMLAGIDGRRFADGPWVGRLLHRFAEYYFTALDAYERETSAAPPVWQVAHSASADRETWAIQKLLLGVNAHINYDLVLTLEELLRPDWAGLSADQRRARRTDYDTVNLIINDTIDAVQDEVLEPAMPIMDWIDRLMGPADERLLSRLLTGWRDQVWDDTLRLMATRDTAERVAVIASVETAALRRAQAIRLTDWTAFDEFM